MIRQEAFNRVWKWFVIERHGPSADPKNNVPLYRGKEGCRCPVGVLLPDDYYEYRMEGLAVKSLLDPATFPRPSALLMPLGESFVMDLQGCHDNAAWAAYGSFHSPTESTNLAYFRKLMEKNLRELADLYDLSIPASNETIRQEQLDGSGKAALLHTH